MPCRSASACAAFAVFTPSATSRVSPRICSSVLPRPSSTPPRRVRESAPGQGGARAPPTGEPAEGREPAAEGDAELGHLVQAARDERGVGVRAEAEAFEDARGDGDDILERAGELDAADVVGAIEPERAAAEHALRGVREVVFRRCDDGDGGIAARGLEGEGRPGEDGEGAQLVAEDLRGDLRHRLERLVLDAFGAGDDVGALEVRQELGEDAPVVMARHDHEQRVAELRRLGQRMRRADVRVELDRRHVDGIAPIAPDALRHARIVSPQKDVVPRPRRDDGHGGAEGAGADDRNPHERSFGSPSRRSVPCAMRAMLEWCLTMIRMEMPMETTVVQNGACERNRRNTGNEAALTMDASDTKRMTSKTMKKMMSEAATAMGSSARNAPVAVATPLPPWNRSQTGNMCPTTATSAAKAIQNAAEGRGEASPPPGPPRCRRSHSARTTTA